MKCPVLAHERIRSRQDGEIWGVEAPVDAEIIVSRGREVFRRYSRWRGETTVTKVEAIRE
jgi:hypothetical protein